MRPMSATTCALVILTAITGCNSNEETQATTPEATEPAAAAPTGPVQAALVARIGGVIINAQRFFVEVFPRANGEVEAKIYDPQGNEVTGEAGAALVVKVQGKDQQAHDVSMQWDAESGRFRGHAGAGVEVDTGTVEVRVTPREGEAATGRIDTVAVAPEAQGGGTILIAGELAAEVRAEADGKVNAVVLDATGAPVTGEGSAEVTVNVKGPDAELRPVTLAWNAEAGLWTGQIQGEFQVTPGPMEVVIERNGASHRGRIEVAAIAPQPRAGGHVVITGDHSVELIAAPRGKVEAVIVDARGQPVTGQANVNLTVNVGVGADLRPVTLVWNAEREKWVGDVQGQVEIGTTPVEVVLVANGRRRHGRWGRGLALGHAHARGQLRIDAPTPDIAGAANVRVGAPGAAGVRVTGPRGVVDVTGPRGNVNVTGPRGSVRVNAPSGGAAAGVRVQGPAAGVSVGGAASASAGARASAEAEAAEARRRAEEARRRAAAAGSGGVSAMGGVSIMAGGGVSIGQ